MLTPRRTSVLTALTTSLLWTPLGLVEEASADVWGGTECSEEECEVTAGVTEVETPHDSRGLVKPESTAMDPVVDRSAAGRAVDLVAAAVFSGVLEKGTVYRTDDCRVRLAESGIKDISCGDAAPSVVKGGAVPPVHEVGLVAVEKLRLPAPEIRMSPAEDAFQVVGVPSWLWVDSGMWQPVVESAHVPGLTVTATARPVRVVWLMGDGGRVVCEGPGTPWSSAFGAASPSPDCGYTYTRSSLAESGGRFRVSAALEWDVVWEGGGSSGRVPGLVTVDEVEVVVDEIQALVVNQ
ncbi:hypothetical protein ACTWP5_29400 [Streptomyces sp. 4N509B]|uniref:hypothetical protein n=1 Tax=Streptomyces sp. 4N509B TaxID=3457413 RepID=UPI003FCF2B0A